MNMPIIGAAIAAALLAASPSLAGSPSRQPATVSQERISVVVEGSGPDVVLIPGLASSREVWRGLADQLKRTHRLHLVQLAGFAGEPPIAPEPPVAGGSGNVVAPAAEAVAEYIFRERLGKPAIIGHSLGGELALMVAARHPERAGRVMVVDALPFYSLLFDPGATPQSVGPRAGAFRDAMIAAPAEQADAMHAASIARLAKTPAVRPALVAAGRLSDRRTVADATFELMTTDLRPELAQIKAPVQVVYAYDPAYGVPSATIDTLFTQAYSGLPGARLTRIDNSFHFIMLDQPRRYAETVTAFLRD